MANSESDRFPPFWYSIMVVIQLQSYLRSQLQNVCSLKGMNNKLASCTNLSPFSSHYLKHRP